MTAALLLFLVGMIALDVFGPRVQRWVERHRTQAAVRRGNHRLLELEAAYRRKLLPKPLTPMQEQAVRAARARLNRPARVRDFPGEPRNDQHRGSRA